MSCFRKYRPNISVRLWVSNVDNNNGCCQDVLTFTLIRSSEHEFLVGDTEAHLVQDGVELRIFEGVGISVCVDVVVCAVRSVSNLVGEYNTYI